MKPHYTLAYCGGHKNNTNYTPPHSYLRPAETPTNWKTRKQTPLKSHGICPKCFDQYCIDITILKMMRELKQTQSCLPTQNMNIDNNKPTV